ncbi:MAG: LysE family transporter [Ferruginibacter sp.]
MTDAIVSGLLLGLLLVFSVGPVIFTIIKLRLNYGLTSAFYFISGVWLSDLLWAVTANVFGELLRQLFQYKLQIASVGSALLIGMGIYYLFFKKYHSKEQLDQGLKIGSSTHISLFFAGFLMNTLNPGVITLWFAAATKSLDNTIQEKIIIFSICLILNMSADVFKINLAGKLRKKLTDRNLTIINKISGILFILFGAALVIGAYATLKHS